MGRYQNGTLETTPTSSGDTYYLRFTNPDGVHPRRPRVRVGLKTDFKKVSDLNAELRRIRDKFNAGELAETPVYTVAKLIDKYEDEEMPVRYSTARGYRQIHKLYIRPRWGDTPLPKIAPLEVRAWLRDLHLANGKLASSKTRGHVHTQFKNLLKFAMLWDWMPREVNRLSLFSLEGATKRTRVPRVISPEKFRDLITYFDKTPTKDLNMRHPVLMIQLMLMIAYCLGLRVSEMIALRWQDVDFLSGTIHIHRATVRGRTDKVKTERSEAPLPLAPALSEYFRRWKAKTDFAEDVDWVFSSPRRPGRAVDPNKIQSKVLHAAGKAVGLDFPLGWHTFRHSYKSLLDRVSTDATLKRDLMRHSDVHTTMQVYGEVEMDRLRAANSAAVDMALGQKPN